MGKTTVEITVKKMKENFTTRKWLPTTVLFIGIDYQLGHRHSFFSFADLIFRSFSSFVFSMVLYMQQVHAISSKFKVRGIKRSHPL